MKQILTLIDFTETAHHALSQSIELATFCDASVVLCHISKDLYGEIPPKKIEAMKAFEVRLNEADIPYEVDFQKGDLFYEAAKVVDRIRPLAVVVGTHGKRGLTQHLFGAHVYKLVKKLHAPTIVLSDDSRIVKGGYSKVLMPVAPHADFLTKVKETAALMNPKGMLTIFAVRKSGGQLPRKILNNVEEATEYLNGLKMKWEYVEHEFDHYSIGYERAISDYANAKGMELVSVKAQVSEDNKHFGEIDKESLLLNSHGTHTLCTN